MGTLTGHAAGDDNRTPVDQTVVVNAVGNGVGEQLDELPEPLTSVVDYLGDDLDRREFVPTTELVDALDIEPIPFGRQLRVSGCHP